jgi:hypothetical protein
MGLNETLLSKDEHKSSSIESVMIKIEQLKNKTREFINNNCELMTHKRFAATYFIFLRCVCKLYYEIPRLMDDYFSELKMSSVKKL